MSAFARTGAVAGLELRTAVARPLWWGLLLGAAILTLSVSGTAFLPQGEGSPGSPRPWINSVFALTAFFGLSGMVLYTLFASIIAGLAVIRDDETGVSPLLHATPLRPAEYVWGKFIGATAALGLILCAHLGFAVIARELLSGPGQAGPFRIGHYLGPALLSGAPPLVLFSGVAFALGERWRRPLAVFTLPLALLFSLPFLLGWSPPAPEPFLEAVLVLVDPSGLRWFLTRGLGPDATVSSVNGPPIAYDALFWGNRTLMTCLGLAAVASAARHCARWVRLGGALRWSGAEGADEEAAGVPSPRATRPEVHLVAASKTSPREGPSAAGSAPLDSLQMTARPPALWPAARWIAGSQLRDLVGQPILWVFPALCAALVWQESASRFGPFGAPLIPTSGELAVSSHFLLTFAICTILLFVLVEALERGESSGVDRFALALPVRTGSLVLGWNLVGAVTAVVLLASAAAAGVAVVVLDPQARLDWRPLLWVYGAVLLPTALVWNAFVTGLWAAVRNRYTVYALALGALALTERSLRREWMNWVWNWTAVGTLRWSELSGLAPNELPLLLNRGLVLSVAGLLLIGTGAVFARPVRDAHRWRPVAAGVRRPRIALRILALAGTLLSLGLAGILWNGIQAGPQGARAAAADAEYRRLNLDAWGGALLPEIRHLELDLDLEPARRAARVQGVYTLVNTGSKPVRTLPFTVRPAGTSVAWRVDGVPVQVEDRSGLHVVPVPGGGMAPGDQTRVSFSFSARYPAGFTRNGGGLPQFLLPSGVLLHTLRDSFLPTLGVVSGIGRTRANATVPQAWPPEFWKEPQSGPVPYTTALTVSAPVGFVVNAVGDAVSSFVRNGRTVTRWTSEVPVGAVAIAGGPLETVSDGGVAVSFHPDHRSNGLAVVETLSAARHRFSEWFHPYPWAGLRLTEFPAQTANAMGFPTHIPFSEALGFRERAVPPARPAFFVTAHEAAHQWWGNLLPAGEGPGTIHLVEGMASWAALLLAEVELGPAARKDLMRTMERHYLERRDVERERPVGRMVDDSDPTEWTVVYEKGAWVQWMLQDLLGRDAMLEGLRAFLADHVGGRVRPTLQDMLGYLRPRAPDPAAFDAFVDQWFFDVVLPEFRIQEVDVAAPTPARAGSTWEVVAVVEQVGTGEVEVDVALVGAEAREIRTVRLGSGGRAAIRWEVRFPPREIVVDPEFRVLQSARLTATHRVNPKD